MKSETLIRKLEQLAPPRLALSFDNPGLICGRHDKEIRRVLLSLDATEDCVSYAVSHEIDLLLTHHPMIFHEIKQVNDETPAGRKLLALIRADICCYAMHTNFDLAKGCMADLVCERMGILKETPLEPCLDENGDPLPYGLGFVGCLPEALSTKELAGRIRDRFSLAALCYYDSGKPNHRVAVCPGSGRGILPRAISAGADVLVTGDMGHHDGIDALDEGLSLIDAGHYGLEHLFTAFMENWLQKEAPELTLLRYETDDRQFLCASHDPSGQ